MKPYTKEQVDEGMLYLVKILGRFGPTMSPEITDHERYMRDGLVEDMGHLGEQEAKRALGLAYARLAELRAGFVLACGVLQSRAADFRSLAEQLETDATASAALFDAQGQIIEILKDELRGRVDTASQRAKRAADSLHNRPNGSREKARKLREDWASGEYRSRDECAEKAGGKLKMTFSTARRALRNTPEPVKKS